jgi:hypothetical protein
MFIAETLGKFEHEVADELTIQEYNRWIAYFRVKEQKQEQERRRQRNKRGK